MSDAKQEDIIIVRKKSAGHGGHHGGAWKVAYADFVTAMMSLFIVLWLTSTNDAVKKSVAQYFNDPKGTANRSGTNLNGSGHSVPLAPNEVQQLKQRLMNAARTMPDFDRLKGQIEIVAEQDGLRIELLEQPGGTFFELGRPEPTPALKHFLQAISPELGKMPTRISIEGHTDSVPYVSGAAYTNWELSADRANAARRLMTVSGVQQSQIAEVRGFADQLPRRPDAPADASNRRITLIVQPIPASATTASETTAVNGSPHRTPSQPGQKLPPSASEEAARMLKTEPETSHPADALLR